MTAATSTPIAQEVWLARRAAHEARVEPWLAPRLSRTSLSQRHPVDDFLFEYYSYRPGQLRRWHPGIGTGLAGQAAEEYLTLPHYARRHGGIGVCASTLKPARLAFVRWLCDLLGAVQGRAPFLGCAGLHEWAMVYRIDAVRHPRWPLRLGAAGTAAVVESLPVRCSHHDAFRFFTPGARPLNRLQPTRTEALSLEQPGCLHTNMDLYKWAYKLAPYTPSELIAETFALARDIREVDMRASPYDLSELGCAAIPIETSEGRADYETHQRAFALRAVPLRTAVISVCRQILSESEDR